jgi:circadian clock protein KaiC
MTGTEKECEERRSIGIRKCPTGIPGLDQITEGGFPEGRPTLVCGGTGTGKTLLAMQFLVNGALRYDEPGVFMSFEENAADLIDNVASLDIDLQELEARKKFLIDHVQVERCLIEETGSYDLEGLFVRLAYDIDSIGARRVVLDTIETLFAALSNEGILRSELQRIFRWLKEKGVTVLVTCEQGSGTLTRHGLEEYVSDCVIMLEQNVEDQVATRRLRIVKYRGSSHGTNRYPFLLDRRGLTVVPVTAIGLDYAVSTEVISSGIAKLDALLGAGGYFRGSVLLVSGTAGCGKTSVAAQFIDAACRRGERCLFYSFEESQAQIIRNMKSIGLDLQQWADNGLLRLEATRPASTGLDAHLAAIRDILDEFQPSIVVIDPVTSLESFHNDIDVKTVLMSLVDLLKSRSITAMFTSLTDKERSEVGITTLTDAWLLLRNLELGGERTRTLYILKSRGMSHSHQVREFVLSDSGVDLVDVYMGPAGVLAGSARVVQEMQEHFAQLDVKQEIERRRMLDERRRVAMESRIAQLRAEFEIEQSETERFIADAAARSRDSASTRARIADGRSGVSGAKQKEPCHDES